MTNDLIVAMERAKNAAYEAGKNFVIAKAEFSKHEAIKKTRLAQLIHKAEGESYKAKENNALMSKEWQDYLTALEDLELKKNKWQLEQQRHRDDWETIRSKLSLIKHEMRHLNDRV